MPMCLQRINDVENMSFTAVPSFEDQENLRRFHGLLALLKGLSERDAIEMYRDEQETPPSATSFSERTRALTPRRSSTR